MDRAFLRELQEQWARAVLFGDRAHWPEPRPLRCWFGAVVPGLDSCDGPIEGAHWIKRQRVERSLADRLRWALIRDNLGVDLPLEPGEARDLITLAVWDPRNGVPACEKHHRRFDGHRVDATNELVVWRHEVPAPVEAFAKDWGLETALEDRHPPIGGGV